MDGILALLFVSEPIRDEFHRRVDRAWRELSRSWVVSPVHMDLRAVLRDVGLTGLVAEVVLRSFLLMQCKVTVLLRAMCALHHLGIMDQYMMSRIQCNIVQLVVAGSGMWSTESTPRRTQKLNRSSPASV